MQFTREEETTAELNMTEYVLRFMLQFLWCWNPIPAERRLLLMTG